MITWNVLRAGGIGAYLMLWGSVAWGLFASTGLGATRFARASSTWLHRFLSTAGLVLLGVHLVGVLLDREIGFAPLDLLLPGSSEWRPTAITFGIISMYLMVIIVASSIARKQIGTVWWRRLHLLAIPAFIMAFGHGVFAGTDTERPWMFWTYVLTGVSLVFLVMVRGLTARATAKRTPAAERKAVPAKKAAPDEAAAPVPATAP